MTDTDFIEGFKLRNSASTKVVLGWIGEAVSRLHWTDSLSREDIVSQASMNLFELVSQPNQPPISSPKGLIHHIVKCVAVDAVRREKRRKAMEEKLKHLPLQNPDPAEIYLLKENMEIYLRARAAADPMCRELWDMLFTERSTYREIAEKLRISEGTLRVRLLRCKDKAMEWIRKNT
ncbi:MAG: sigma-70 family RNA polymerase sigma factor [Bacteroidetes bacterium]|nr:sigma-70 family RNA polymerase sigma factor [Bacteroidota bacterium]MCW5895019.1 sigma-70 family RNA polymerase sigma factor [Bacteroidota bacterium]